jgi:hypothetical protein
MNTNTFAQLYLNQSNMGVQSMHRLQSQKLINSQTIVLHIYTFVADALSKQQHNALLLLHITHPINVSQSAFKQLIGLIRIRCRDKPGEGNT